MPVPVQVHMLCSHLCLLSLVVAVTCPVICCRCHLCLLSISISATWLQCLAFIHLMHCKREMLSGLVMITQQYVLAFATCLCMYIFQVIGEDACPGLKQNGFPYLIRRTVECLCPGDAIPATIEVDISGLNLGQTVLLPHLKLPSGVKLVAPVPLWLCQCFMTHVLPIPLLLPLPLLLPCARSIMNARPAAACSAILTSVRRGLMLMKLAAHIPPALKLNIRDACLCDATSQCSSASYGLKYSTQRLLLLLLCCSTQLCPCARLLGRVHEKADT